MLAGMQSDNDSTDSEAQFIPGRCACGGPADHEWAPTSQCVEAIYVDSTIETFTASSRHQPLPRNGKILNSDELTSIYIYIYGPFQANLHIFLKKSNLSRY